MKKSIVLLSQKAIIIPVFLGGILLITVQCTSVNKQSAIVSLVKIAGTLDTSVVKAGTGVKISVIKTGNGNGYKMDCDDMNNLHTIVFKEGKEKWRLSKYIYLAVDITNPGSEDLLVECYLNDRVNLISGGGQIIPAGKTRAIRTYICQDVYPKYLDKKFFGMFAYPGGHVNSWTGLHPDSINRFTLALMNPPKNTTIIINKIRGEGSFKFLTEKELEGDYFPLLDEFGQFRHKDWPGKTHSAEELLKSKDAEADDISANPVPEEWDKYGGWLKGPKLTATGSFRTEKVNGKWWLVDPLGNLYWSKGMGMSVILDEQATPITDREHYFTNLPDSTQFKDFYGTHTWTPLGYYKGRSIRVYNNYAFNLSRKYGNTWKSECFHVARARLGSWGMNAYSSWSVPTILGMDGISYAAQVNTRNARRIEGSNGYWGKFPDPFDKSFREAITNWIENIKKSVSDPYCIGYFVDNEMEWGDNSYLARTVIQSSDRQPSKLVMLDFLKKKYNAVSKLNASWQTGFKSWNDFLKNTKLLPKETGDLKEFSAVIAQEYFKVVKETLKKAAPQKLYLGCRFADHYYPDADTTANWVVKIAGDYCDVISFSRYRYSATDLRPADSDKPVLISEFDMGALDRGLFSFSLRFAENQENRAEMYEYFIKSCLKNPFIVGAHWFEYCDEPVLGRFEGENYNTGFVDACDRPYPEMVRGSRYIGRTFYSMRY